MNLIELNRSLRELRLGGIAAVLETRLQQAQAEPMAPIDFLSHDLNYGRPRENATTAHLKEISFELRGGMRAKKEKRSRKKRQEACGN